MTCSVRLWVYLSTCSIWAILSTNVAAQTSPTGSSASDSEIQEIVVTANKREEKLNEVGSTIAAFTGDALRSHQIVSPDDLASVTPSLSYTRSGTGTPVLTLRGVGFYDQSLDAFPTVPIYSDEVPYTFLTPAKHALFDLERVEILEGPQGTLFGSNATGGAINYISAKPTKDFQAGTDLTYGRFNEADTESFVSGPLADNLQGRLSVRTERADGWQISNTRPDDTNGKVNNFMGRFQLAYEPTESARFLLNINGWKDKSEPEAAQVLSLFIQHPIVFPDLANLKTSPLTSRAADWDPDLPVHGDSSMWQVSLRGDIDLTPAVTLTSLSSYMRYLQNQGEDESGAGFPLNSIQQDLGRITAFSQELRLSNPGGHTIRWVVGGDFDQSKVDENTDSGASYNNSSNSTFAPLGYTIDGDRYETYQSTRDYAAFGNIEWSVPGNVTLKGGARYTDTSTSAHDCEYSDAANPGIGVFTYDVLLGGKYGQYPVGSCWAVNNEATTIGGVAQGAPGEFVGTLDQHNIAWRGGVDWKIQPDTLLYANVAKGYKQGGFPNTNSSVFSSSQAVTQESVLSYEGGAKAGFFDHRLEVNAAAYYYDYKNKQLDSKIVVPFFGIVNSLENIPKSHVLGTELEVTMRPTRALSINLGFTYTDAVIDQFTGINAAGQVANFAGSAIPYTPKYQFVGNVDYTFPLTSTLDGYLGGGVNTRSATKSVIGSPASPAGASVQSADLFGIDGYTTVNLQAGVASHDGHWRATIWGKNVFDKYYWNNTAYVFDDIVRYAGMPATYGITVSYRH
jgi:iron complex outermembrane recepter protein